MKTLQIAIAILMISASALFSESKPHNISQDTEDFEFVGEDENQRLLFQASKAGDLDLLRAVVGACRVNEAVDTGGRSPLIWAARYSHVHIVEALLNAGADANAASIYGCTALMWGARNGNCKAIQILLSYGACIDAVNDDGDTALREAERYHHKDAIEMLIANGAEHESGLPITSRLNER